MTKPDIDTQRLEAALRALAEQAECGDKCPEAGLIYAAFSGDLEAREARKLALHTVTCAACSQVARLARELVREIRPDTGEVSVSSTPSWITSWWGWGSFAAAAASILILVTAVGLQREPDTPTFRAPSKETVRSLIPPDQPLPRDRCLLRWSGPEGATYNIRVSTPDLSVLATARRLEQAEFQVPPESLVDMNSGSEILWQVEAVLPEGERVQSPTFRSRLE